MATITTDTYLDDGTARTAGEAWTINNGARLTVRTDTRWHAGAPASMAGSIANQTINDGEILIDGRNVRWLAYNSGSGNVPAIGTSVTQSGTDGYLLGVYGSLTAAPSTVGSAMPTSGFLKLREVSGSFTTGAINNIGATSAGADVTGWIEVVGDAACTITVTRLGKYTIRGDWFYLDNTDGSVGQIIQIPTNGGGVGTKCPGLWIETAPGSTTYEYWPSLDYSTVNGWSTTSIGAAYTETDARQNFVKDIDRGQIQIGENVDTSATYVSITQSTRIKLDFKCSPRDYYYEKNNSPKLISENRNYNIDKELYIYNHNGGSRIFTFTHNNQLRKRK